MTTLEFTAPVQTLMPRVEELMLAQADGYRPEIGIALDQLLNAGGKRVRPTVALLSCGMLGVDEENAVTLAAAVEMLHTATLVHDDLIDGALIRRGNPTLNSQWNASATVLAGDFLFSQSAWLAAAVGNIEIMRMFAKTLSTIVNGEIGQVFSLNGPTHREEYYERIYAKTASMFELAAKTPAYLVPGGDQYKKALSEYGREIGLAFQIVDDVLDFSSDAGTIGKPAAHDLRQGLLTLPALYYAESEGDGDIRALLDGEHLDEARMEALIDSIRSSPAMTRTMEDAREHSHLALDALESLPDCPERVSLAELARYVVSRLH